MSATTFELAGRTVNRIGFGAMQLPGPGVWGPPRDPDAAKAVLVRALELGVNHIDTAQFYGPDVANELIREALHPYPAELTIVTKVGARRDESRAWLNAMHPQELRAAVEENLRTLGLEAIHLVNLRMVEHEEGEKVPLPDALGALGELRDEGKIEAIGASNVSLAELREAQAITTIACVQNDFSVFERGNQDLLDACSETGAGFVPYFPLGSAFGGGPQRLAQEPHLSAVAARHEASNAQVALAWLLHRSENVLLIPGTSSVEHLEQNMAAADIKLSDDDLAELDAVSSA